MAFNNCLDYKDSVIVFVPEINGLINPVEVDDEQSEGDSVQSDIAVIGDEGENTDNDGQNQRDAERQNGQPNDEAMPIAPTQEQGDADQDQNQDQGQDDDVPMTAADNGEDVASAQNDKENVQPPQNAVAVPSSSSSTTAPLQPAPIGHALMDGTNRAKKCFKCIETFYQEKAFINHLAHFHGIRITKPNDENEPIEPNEQKEPGQFVRNPAKKRKSKTAVEDTAFDENANSRSAERKMKIKKTQSSPAN